MNEDGEINIIYARSDNYVIGMENDIPWDIPTDMQFFKDVTKHHVIIMGRKTYESIGRALPKRTNIVITSKEINDENILTYSSLEAAIDDHQDEDIFIIGGAKLYHEAFDHADHVYETEIFTVIPCDGKEFETTYLSGFDKDKWELMKVSDIYQENGYKFVFKKYKRR